LRLQFSSLNTNLNKHNKKQTLAQLINNRQQQLPLDIKKDNFRLLLDDTDLIDNFNDTVNEKMCMERDKAVKQSDRHRHLNTDPTIFCSSTFFAYWVVLPLLSYSH
jgi:hypothetical protein